MNVMQTGYHYHGYEHIMHILHLLSSFLPGLQNFISLCPCLENKMSSVAVLFMMVVKYWKTLVTKQEKAFIYTNTLKYYKDKIVFMFLSHYTKKANQVLYATIAFALKKPTSLQTNKRS